MTGCDCPQLLLYSLVVIDSNVNNLPGEATSKEPLGKGPQKDTDELRMVETCKNPK